MVANVEIEYWKGGTNSDPMKIIANNFRFRTDDNANTIDNSNPLIIPETGSNFSYWTHIALALSGTFTEVSNIRFFSSGNINWDLGTGGKIVRGNRDTGDNGCSESDYRVATGMTSITGNPIDDETDGHEFYKNQVTPITDIENDLANDTALIDSSVYTSSGSTKAVVLQAEVTSNANSGTETPTTLTFLYDEI